MTKKLSLAALALVSACYFTACDDDSSSVAASADEPSSSASVTSSEDKADPESSASKDADPVSSAETAEGDGNSSSSIKIDANCDIAMDSDKWEFDAKTDYEGTKVSVKGSTVFEGSTAMNTLNASFEFKNVETCAIFKMMMSGDISSMLPPGVDLPDEVITDSEDKPDIQVECDDMGNLTMVISEVEENVTEASKKESYDEMVQVCQDIQNGNLSSLMGDDEE